MNDMTFPSHFVQQQVGNWYVIEEEFPWDIRQLQRDVAALIGQQETMVIFCDTCDANRILSSLGEEEEEFLFPINGFYHCEKQIVFICVWEEYERVLETLLHELRHDMQYMNQETRHFFSYSGEQYEKRWIEGDARQFAKEKMNEYYTKMKSSP